MRVCNFVILILSFCLPAAFARDLTDADIRSEIVRSSIASYKATGHPCACPYDSGRNGSSCGKRSAYTRPGGAAPLCYPKDISDAQVAEWRKTHSVLKASN